MKNILKKTFSIFLVLAFVFEMFPLTDVSIWVEAETVCKHARCEPITYDSSCERNGMIYYVCVDCDDFVGEPIPIPPKGHSFGDWITEKEPTCTTKGSKYSICSVCDKRQDEDIPETGHSYKSTEVKPTCTEDGFTRHVCTTCNASYSDGYTEAMGHDFAEKTIAPTCENKGYTLYTCSRSGCGYSTKDNYIDALGHIYRKQTVPSTCEEKGYTLYTCKYCGDNFKDNYKDQTGHLYGSWTIDFSPTCSQEGQKSRTCSACGNKETEAIDKTDHNYNKTVISPTCTENGYTENICSECGDYYIDNYVETSGHSYGKWNVTEATVLEEGSKSRICTVCEYVETETIPRVEINIEENSNYGLVIFTIVKAQSEPVSGAKIFISTEKDGENTFTTDKNGKVSVVLPVGEQKISVYADGCKIRNPQITVNPGVNELHSIALSEFPVYDVKFTSEEMTLEEMREAGVDTTAEENKQSYKYELKLDFDPEVDAESIVACFDADGNFIGGHYKDPTPDKEESEEVESGYSLHYHVVTDGLFHSWCKYVSVEEGETVDLTYIPWREDAHNYIFKGWYEDSACTKDIYEVKIKDKNTKVYGKWEYIGPEEEKAEKPKGIRIPSKKEDITVYPVSENFYLIIRGEVSWIKEMFDVQMLVINNSDNATLENLKAELTLPEGLSLAEMVGEQQELTQEIETIEALGSRSVNWYVRGDTEGSYSLEANLTGEICEGKGITEPINDRFVCENQIQVWAGSALHLNFEFPNATYYGDDYPIKITLENVSDKELYGVNHKVQIEQGMEIFYSDGTSKSKIEKSSWENRGVSVFKPGDKLIIETSVNIFFESEILEKELEKYSGIVDGIETFLAGYKAVKIGIKAWNSFCKTMTGSISALKNFEASAGSSEEKVELFRQLHDKLSGLYTSYGTSGNKAFDAAVSVVNSGLGATLNAIAKDPDDWLTNHAKNDVEKVLNDVEKLGDSLFENKETDTSFDIFDSIRTFISAIPIRFVLSSVIMREDENNTTSIPWDYTVSEASPQYFGVTNVSKYLMSLLQAGFSDSVSQYLWLLAGVDDPFNKTDAVKYIKATENEIAKIKAKDATGKVSFKAWVERGSSGTSVTNDFVLSCDNNTAEYTDGVLTFTGDGMISVTPQNSDSGTLFIEDSEGNLYTYVLDVVGQHKCASTQNKTVVCPFEGNDGFAVKRCDVCDDILDVVILERDSIPDSETTVDVEILFGADRFTFGEDMSGCVGDTLSGLLVYTSADNDVSSLKINSSNTSVIEVGTIKSDSGDYICGENEHRATVPLNLKSEGTATITITSPEGVSESIIVTVSSKTPDLTEEEKQYINEHANFVKSNNYKNLVTNASFYNQIWKHEEGSRNFTRYAAWEVIGDVGKAFAFDFKGAFSTDNPYDVILLDVLQNYTNNTKNGFMQSAEKGIKFLMGASDLYKDTLDVFKTSDAWSSEFEKPLYNFTEYLQKNWLKGNFFNINSFDLDDYDKTLYNELSETIPKLTESKVTKVFKGLSNASVIIDIISSGSDVVASFYDAYQKYLIAQAVYESNIELLNALQISANAMGGNASILLKEALQPYMEAFTLDNTLVAVIKIMDKEDLYTAENAAYEILLKGITTEFIYGTITAITGISAGSLVATYNLTYMLLDYLSGLGKLSETHTLMNAAALLERQFISLTQNYGTILSSNQTIGNAKAFDSAWGFLQSLEGYCYKTMSVYASASKQEYGLNYAIDIATNRNPFNLLISTIQLEEDLTACDAAIQTVVYLENEWYKYKCHNGNYTKSKLGSVKCPTDVYIYDSSGILVLSIVDNRIVSRAENITAFVDGDEKIFVLPTDQEYDIKITATDNGTMDYAIKAFDSLELERVVAYEDISLVKNKNHYGDIPVNADVPSSDYDLIADDGNRETADVDEYIKDSTISVVNMPTKTEYNVGEVLDTTGLKLKVVYEDGTTKTITSGFECSPTKFDSEGTKTVNVVYGGAMCSFEVIVKPAITTITSFEVTTLPTKTNYHVGDKLDTTGLTAKITYSNGKVYTLSDDVLTCIPETLITVGKQQVTVAYKTATCTFDVSVAGHHFSEWEITEEPTDTEDGIKIRTCSVCGEAEESIAVRTGITVTLIDAEENVIMTNVIDGNSVEFEFRGFEDGEYTATFEKANYVTRKYDIAITAGECTCEIDLHKLGDINGDGKVNTVDVARANAHAKGVSSLVGYDFTCVDVNGDSRVNTIDVARMNAHAKGVNSLW